MQQNLKLGEVAKIESITGYSIEDNDQPVGKRLAAMVFVAQRRSNPKFTLEDAYDMDMEEAGQVVAEVFGITDDELQEAMKASKKA